MKLLLTGATGQLGHVLKTRLRACGEVIAPERAQLDLADGNAIRTLIDSLQPDLIVNAAAYTAEDLAETDVHAACAINAAAPAVLAQQAQQRKIGLIHFSTDYVFDGSGDQARDEQAAPNPLNVYGLSKLAGEQAIARYCEHHWIFRTSWVYGAHGGNFLKTILRLAQERDSMNVVADQIGAPTSTATIADVLLQLLHRTEPTDSEQTSTAQVLERMASTRGIYHLSAHGETSWHHYAQTIVNMLTALQQPLKLSAGAINAVPSAAYPTAAKRPLNSRLCVDKLEQGFGLHLPAWDTAVAQCIEQLTGKQLPKHDHSNIAPAEPT